MTDPSATLLYQKILCLTQISNKNIGSLFHAISKKELLKGEIVLNEGVICNTIFFVENGYLRTYFNKDGTEINSDFTFEGNFTTNLKSLHSSMPSDKVIQAGQASTVYEFDRNKLLAIYEGSPEIESFGRKLLEELLMAQEEHSNLFKIFSATERYHYISKHNPELLQRISLSQLASYLGLTRETLSRIRRKK